MDEAGVKRDTPRRQARQDVSVPTDFLDHAAQDPESWQGNVDKAACPAMQPQPVSQSHM
jgi:hypothetical protein